jgi:hypothetical protein
MDRLKSGSARSAAPLQLRVGQPGRVCFRPPTDSASLPVSLPYATERGGWGRDRRARAAGQNRPAGGNGGRAQVVRIDRRVSC